MHKKKTTRMISRIIAVALAVMLAVPTSALNVNAAVLDAEPKVASEPEVEMTEHTHDYVNGVCECGEIYADSTPQSEDNTEKNNIEDSVEDTSDITDNSETDIQDTDNQEKDNTEVNDANTYVDVENENPHTLAYTINEDGTHSAVCTDVDADGNPCTYIIENEEHTFVDGVCICGLEENTEEDKNIEEEALDNLGDTELQVIFGPDTLTGEGAVTSGDGWSYDAATNVLTLNGYNTPFKSESADGTWKPFATVGRFKVGIYSSGDLTIDIVGNNSLSMGGYNNNSTSPVAIYVVGKLTFTGSGDLDISSENQSGHGDYCIIAGDLESNSTGNISLEGTNSPIDFKNLTINSGVFDMSKNAILMGNIYLNGGTFKIANVATSGSYQDTKIEINGGKWISQTYDKNMISYMQADDILITGGEVSVAGYGIRGESTFVMTGGKVNTVYGVTIASYNKYKTYAALSTNNWIEISGGDLTASGNNSAIRTGALRITGDYSLLVGDSAETAYSADEYIDEAYIHISYTEELSGQTKPSTDTIVTIKEGDGTAVTDSVTSGTGWSYEATTKTLTLNGYSGEGYSKINFSDRVNTSCKAAIYADGDLNLVIEGENNIVGENSIYSYGIYCDGNLTISGSGQLSASKSDIAIHARKNLVINGGSLDLKGRTDYSDTYRSTICTTYFGNLIINGGIINAIGGIGTSYNGQLIITDGEITADWVRAMDILISGGNVASPIGKCENGSTVKITGGVVGTESSVHECYGKFTLNGGTLKGKYLLVSNSTGHTLHPESGLYINGGTLLLGNSSASNSWGIQCLEKIVINGGSGKIYGTSNAINDNYESMDIGRGVSIKTGSKYGTASSATQYNKEKYLEFSSSGTYTSGYTVKFLANESLLKDNQGTTGAAVVNGTMADQSIAVNKATALTANAYSVAGYKFTSWNTKADGTGTSYSDKQSVTGIGVADETIKLYAQWELVKYKITCAKGNYDITYTDAATGASKTLDNINTTCDMLTPFSFRVIGKTGYKVTSVYYKVGDSEQKAISVDIEDPAAMYIANGSITADTTITINVSKVISVTNTPGGYTLSLTGADAADFNSTISAIGYQTEDFVFFAKANQYCNITSATYKVGTGKAITLVAEATEVPGVNKYTIPKGKITASTVINVNTSTYFDVNIAEGVRFAITNKSATVDSVNTNRYNITAGAANVVFTVTAPATATPEVTIHATDGAAALAEPLTIEYTGVKENKDATLTYSYAAVASAELAGKLLRIDTVTTANRIVDIKYDFTRTSVSARIGSQTLAPNLTPQISDMESGEITSLAVASFEVPVGSTIIAKTIPKDNCTSRITAYAGQATVGTFKTASEVSVKPLEDIILQTECNSQFRGELYEGIVSDFTAAELNALTAVKSVYTVNPEGTYTARIRQGVVDTDASAKITLMNGKNAVSSGVITATAGIGESPTGVFTITNLAEYAGKTLTLNYFADASQTKPTSICKLTVKGNGDTVKSIAIAGAKKNVITQVIGSTKSYKVTVKPANVNLERIYVNVSGVPDGAVEKIHVTNNIAGDGTLSATVSPSALKNDPSEVKVKLYYMSGAVQNIATDKLLAEYTIQPEKASFEKLTPTVKFANSTDIGIYLALATPKATNVNNSLYMYYAISAKAVLDKGATAPAQGMKASIDEFYIPCTNSDYELFVSNLAMGSGKAQKYNVSVSMILTDKIMSSEINESNIYARSKTKTVSGSTKADAYPTKISFGKGTTKFYAEQAVINPALNTKGIDVATVKYDSKATRRGYYTVYIGGPSADNLGWMNMSKADGEHLYICLKEGSTPADIVPGNYTLKVIGDKFQADAKNIEATITFTILNPICGLNVTTPSSSMLKVDKKAITIKPSVAYTGINGNPSAKKVTWSYQSSDEELKQYIKFNAKNGQLTIAKNYVLPAGEQPYVTITATAADFAGNQTIMASKMVVLKSSAAKPASIAISNGDNTVNYGEGDSISYSVGALDGTSIVLKDAQGNVLDNTNFAFKVSTKAVTVKSSGLHGDNAGKTEMVMGVIKKTTRCTITATATDGSGYSIKLNLYLAFPVG